MRMFWPATDRDADSPIFAPWKRLLKRIRRFGPARTRLELSSPDAARKVRSYGIPIAWHATSQAWDLVSRLPSFDASPLWQQH